MFLQGAYEGLHPRAGLSCRLQNLATRYLRQKYMYNRRLITEQPYANDLGDDPTTRLLPLVSLNSPSASQFLSPTLPTNRQDPALFLIDRATGTLVIQCSLKTQHISQSPADVPLFDLKNSCVASNIWHRLQLCVCPARVSVHMDAKPLITLSWKGWKDENGGLIAGMRVLRVRNPGGGRDQESEWNESMWE
eukprot:78463-Amorphochlora_amoeboformis.AAC.1